MVGERFVAVHGSRLYCSGCATDTVQAYLSDRDAGTLDIGSADRDHRWSEATKEVREDVEAAPREEIHLGDDQATRRTTVCYARSPSNGGLDRRP
jgi:hypothetical protein